MPGLIFSILPGAWRPGSVCLVCACGFSMQRCCAVLVCLSMCGHGSGNGTPCAGRAICASFDPLGVYIYAVGGESCRNRLTLEGSAPLIDIAFGDSASLRGIPAVAPTVTALGTSGRVRRGARGLGLSPAPCVAAPVVFAAIRAAMLRRRNTGFSPCDVSHRASGEPRRRMSLSSALAPSSLASPSIRCVFLRSICARRRPVSSLNLVRVSPGAKRSRRRRAQCGVQIRRAAHYSASIGASLTQTL